MLLQYQQDHFQRLYHVLLPQSISSDIVIATYVSTTAPSFA